MFPLEKKIEDQLRQITGPLPVLIFPEAGDSRIIEAVSRLIPFAKIVLVASKESVEKQINDEKIPLGVSCKRFLRTVCFVTPTDEAEMLEEFAAAMVAKSEGRSWQLSLDEARELVRRPTYFSIMAVRLGYADAVLGGVAHSSREFFQPCLRLLEKHGKVYEMGLFALPDSHDAGFFDQNLVMFADVALNNEPSPDALAEIAVGSCITMRNIIPEEDLPNVNGALISYSTRGSGTGPSVERIRKAEPLIEERLTELAKQNPLYKTINIATELQVSCAISEKAARSKLGDEVSLNPAVGRSNVLIVPSLDVGNLLYHIYVTRYPDAQLVHVIGGLRNKALDFSRGSTANDVVVGTKALILQMYRSEEFSPTSNGKFFPRYKILALSPKNSHTHVSLWKGQELVAQERLEFDAEKYSDLMAQLPDRLGQVEDFIARHGTSKESLEAVVSRGGLMLPLDSGTYRIDERMTSDLRAGRSGTHAINLGALLAYDIAPKGYSNVFVVDPPIVDELDEASRITGLAESEQEAAWHALGQKAAAKHYAVKHGKEYEDLKLIVAFLGSGVSVGAHKNGRCTKVRNALFDGPMSPEHSGTLPGMDLIDLCYSGLSKDRLIDKLTKRGGLKSYLGTSDFIEIERRIEAGDEQAIEVVDAMIEQIAGEIASLVPKFGGDSVDQIILTGALTNSKRLCSQIKKALTQLPINITFYPGNRTMEALRDGALRVLNGHETVKQYIPLRDKF